MGLATHAARHGLTVVFANYGGPTGGLAAAGQSAVWADTGERLAHLGTSGRGVVVAVEDDDGGWRATTVPG